MPHLFIALIGLFLILILLIDVFETIVLPRRVTRALRITRLLYSITWPLWRWSARRVSSKRREAVLGVYGPLSLLVLLALWMIGLIIGFAALQWANGSSLHAPEAHSSFATDVYFSSTTLFTLGLGDVVPEGGIARPLTMIEAGIGFGVLALVIGYLPTLYGAFSAREIAVSLLDARAGSPPSAGELLRRYAVGDMRDGLGSYLQNWETWAAELMESHLSYPMLAYFRSQHDNQSWLAALTTILDTCAFILAGLPDLPQPTARLTFAMGRHAVVDLAQIFYVPPLPPRFDRLDAAELGQLRALLEDNGLALTDEETLARKLVKLRAEYEPYVNALSQLLNLSLPPWHVATEEVRQNWRSTAWEPRGNTLL